MARLQDRASVRDGGWGRKSIEPAHMNAGVGGVRREKDGKEVGEGVILPGEEGYIWGWHIKQDL